MIFNNKLRDKHIDKIFKYIDSEIKKNRQWKLKNVQTKQVLSKHLYKSMKIPVLLNTDRSNRTFKSKGDAPAFQRLHGSDHFSLLLLITSDLG